MYVRDNINCHIRQDLHVGNVECIWLELKFKTKKYLYGTFYIPPNSSAQTWEEVEQSIDLALSCNMDIIVTGDFNINQLKGTTTDKINLLRTQFSLHQLISEPTYMTEHSSSLLDLILVNNPMNILVSEVGAPLLNQVRYHLPVIGLIDQPCKPQTSFKRKVYLYDRGDYDSYRDQLSQVNWDEIFENNDVDIISRSVTEIIIDGADRNIPNRIITVRKDSPPWLTTEIKRHIRRKNRLHKRAKRTNSNGNWAKFRLFRNKCNKLVLDAKSDYFSKLSAKITSETRGSRQYWTFIKSLMNSDSSDSRSIPPLHVHDDIICDDKRKAEIFNDFFCSQSNIDDSNTAIPDIPYLQNEGLEQIEISESEVEDILKILNISKASGPDAISPRLLKEASGVLKYPLCKLFNLSLSSGIFPSDWKCANVSPVFKKDSPSNYKNYRPISLISVIGKVMERCVYKHIHNFLVENCIITCNQSGFTSGDSAVYQLLNITNEFGRALDEGKEIRVIFCDISKAFDRVWHKGLLKKLEAIGIRGPLLNWVKNYLSDRKQRVVINNASSNWSNVNAGVPQGSILGPLFFLIFINDIVTDIQSTIKLFADDTSLYLIVDEPVEAANVLNSDLEKIHAWSANWLVSFNSQKTETVIISRKTNKPYHPDLCMNDSIITEVSSHKHLGLSISNDGTFRGHVDMITEKAYRRLNILRKFKFILDKRTLETIYLTYIRPLLEYADVVWDSNTVSLSEKIEKVQIEAARIVTGATRLVSFNDLYLETGWEKLKERREAHRLVHFFKMKNSMTPSYLSDLVPESLGTLHRHNTRNSSIIPPIRTRTALYSNYFYRRLSVLGICYQIV